MFTIKYMLLNRRECYFKNHRALNLRKKKKNYVYVYIIVSTVVKIKEGRRKTKCGTWTKC